MKIVTTNLLNRFWKNGVKPIRDALAGKFDKTKLSNNMLTTEQGFALDARQGPVIMAKLNKLQTEVDSTNSNLTQSTNGKFVLPNGLKICWGRCDSGVITFPVTFAANPTVVATYLNSNTDIRMCVHFTVISTTAARYSGGFKQGDGWSGNYTAGVNWIAIGY